MGHFWYTRSTCHACNNDSNPVCVCERVRAFDAGFWSYVHRVGVAIPFDKTVSSSLGNNNPDNEHRCDAKSGNEIVLFRVKMNSQHACFAAVGERNGKRRKDTDDDNANDDGQMGNVLECSRRIISNSGFYPRSSLFVFKGSSAFFGRFPLPLSLFCPTPLRSQWQFLATKYRKPSRHISILYAAAHCHGKKKRNRSWSFVWIDGNVIYAYRRAWTGSVIHVSFPGLISGNSQCMHTHSLTIPAYAPRQVYRLATGVIRKDSYYYYYYYCRQTIPYTKDDGSVVV